MMMKSTNKDHHPSNIKARSLTAF